MNRYNRLADYLRLAREGRRPPVIARMLGVKVDTVYHQLKVLRRQGHDVPSFERGRTWAGRGSQGTPAPHWSGRPTCAGTT
ncbi:helix-turn-helix domain-containing protein [Meridianimarinicoccus sp. RP-17]|uniref:helix-turn-helix domain-containing protein n=1 Tax=Meridianimarinicoccus zhengii TaxID=2056810 RepID=UPI000DAE767C|nr:helix-turn-helix domain-containing protein [Phycocomes zhengii]